ncbi:MAG TPA: hypothetical protein VH796_10370 [Nitrososphaeraceae archaeon]
MGAESDRQDGVDSTTLAQGSNKTKGIYLFGDYSAFDENKNVIDMLKDFVSISEHVFQIHENVEKLNYLIKKVENLRDVINTKIDQVKLSSESEMDNFFDEIYEKLVKVYFPDQISVESFLRTKNSVLRSINDVERESKISFDEYKSYLESKKIDFYMSSVRLIQAWLSKDENSLPNELISHAMNILIAKVGDTDDQYSITRSTEYLQSADLENINNQWDSMSYSFSVNASATSFWRSHRKIIDLEIGQLAVPIGFKTSISEKLRRSFRLGHSNDHHFASEREPDMVSVENYYITHAKLESGKTLSVILSAEAKPKDKVIRIEYDLNDLHVDRNSPKPETPIYVQVIAEGRVPRIEYIDEKESHKIDLLQKEFHRSTDIERIMDMGYKLEEKLKQLIDLRLISSYINLYLISVDNKEAVFITDSPSTVGHLSYSEDLVASFLEAIASAFAPIIQMLKSKSPVNGELILRYDSPNKQREEYMIRIEDIISRLSQSSGGHKVLAALGVIEEGSANSKA